MRPIQCSRGPASYRSWDFQPAIISPRWDQSPSFGVPTPLLFTPPPSPPPPCRLSVDGGWGEKYRIHILSGAEAPGQYSSLLARSTFCLVAPGEGRSWVRSMWWLRYRIPYLDGAWPPYKL